MFSGDHGQLKEIPQSSFRAVPNLITRLFFGVPPATESVLSAESLKSNGVSSHFETPPALDIQTNRSLPGLHILTILERLFWRRFGLACHAAMDVSGERDCQTVA
jgi:hypothetical protein